MKVIMLSGPSSCGKTTVIKEVYKTLTGSYFPLIQGHNDFETTIHYRGKTLAFQSAGDQPIDAMRKYAPLNYDVLICAHNTNKVNPLKEIQKHTPIIIPKSLPYKDNASCLIDANQIISHI